ncbi:hypothetical protein PIB30_091972 [Stylosanthes scabra]|uniref:Uncharacterized protein n=1 Tax=Stylosanthes scabra TaxID=79078 RepID=A0ABU6ZTI4_9FABA|nr:hypothetical protein [Stylosanthes scabra]
MTPVKFSTSLTLPHLLLFHHLDRGQDGRVQSSDLQPRITHGFQTPQATCPVAVHYRPRPADCVSTPALAEPPQNDQLDKQITQIFVTRFVSCTPIAWATKFFSASKDLTSRGIHMNSGWLEQNTTDPLWSAVILPS